MKKILCISFLSLALLSCERPEKPTSPTPPPFEEKADHPLQIGNQDYSNEESSSNRSESEKDRLISKRTRQAISADDALSIDAKNIKIITINGVVTLRGSVPSADDVERISEIVRNIQGIKQVDNHLEVSKKDY